MADFPAAELHAPCKVNLVLRIEGRRPDGMHELTSVFHPLREPCDVIRIAPAQKGSGLTLRCPGVDCPPEKNLLWRAWDAFARETGLRPDLAITVDKRIPSGAGLGGGSSDAAALLAWLNGCAGEAALPGKKLAEVALALGADVPFFLLCRTALARGVGEELTVMEADLSDFTLLLICPDVHVNTAWAYRSWDERRLHAARPDGLLHILTAGGDAGTGSLCLWPVCLENDFEDAVFPVFSELRRLKERALRLGAAGAVMSGSGASIVAAFRDFKEAEDAAAALRDGQAAGGLKIFVLCP